MGKTAELQEGDLRPPGVRAVSAHVRHLLPLELSGDPAGEDHGVLFHEMSHGFTAIATGARC